MSLPAPVEQESHNILSMCRSVDCHEMNLSPRLGVLLQPGVMYVMPKIGAIGAGLRRLASTLTLMTLNRRPSCCGSAWARLHGTMGTCCPDPMPLQMPSNPEFTTQTAFAPQSLRAIQWQPYLTTGCSSSLMEKELQMQAMRRICTLSAATHRPSCASFRR